MIRKENWSIHRCFVLLFFLVCLLVTVFFRQKFYGEQTETSIGWDTDTEGKGLQKISGNTEIKQVFYAQRGILNYIYVAIDGRGETGTMAVTVFDEKDQEVAVREIQCSQMVESGAQGIPFHIRVKPGAAYYYTISFRDVEDGYPVIQTARCLSESELGLLYVDGVQQEECIFGLFVYQDYYTENPVWRICAFIAVLMALFFLCYPCIPLWNTRLLPVFLAFHSVLSVFLLEVTAGTDIAALGRNRILYNCLICSLVFTVLAAVLWRGKAVLITGTVLCFILGVAEYYVLEFRGTPVVLADLFSAGTAAEVSGNYHFDITPQMVMALLVMLSVFLLESKIRFRKYRHRGRVVFLGFLLLWGLGSISWLKSLPLLDTGKNGGFFWNLSDSYEKYGYFLSTYIYESYQRVEKPESYSGETVRTVTEAYRENGVADAEELPNIIVIMNESFTDFASVGGLETSCPVTPFVDSLEENTVRGNLYVSVFGGGTANTEFEFLTGSTMNFLPSGSTPYQAYIKEELPSLASWLKQYGYTSTVCHFAARKNWNRDDVYPLLGFDTYISEEDVEGLKCIHGFPSDESNYEEILKLYENWKTEKDTEHFFCFNITIQNHGGYGSGYRCENPPQYTGGQTRDDVEEYLSLMRESDRAFENLVHYFENEEEPTILLMFGDHWPRLNNSFINSVANQTETSGKLEKNQNKYVTPFVLWANYDIEEARMERLSANYLSTLLLKTAGVPLNGYQQFLDALSKKVPVINSLGYVDSAGNYFSSPEEMDAQQQQWITDYQILQYDNLFGKKEETFFE